MIQKHIRIFSAVLMIALAGCAATVNKTGPSNPIAIANPLAKKSVVVQVQAAPGMAAVGDWYALQTDWRDGIGVAAGRYGKTVTWEENKAGPYTTPAVLVVVKVRNYKYMTPESRIGLGIFAGNAFVNAEVEFYELPAKNLLGSRVYETSTSAAEGVLSPATRKQVMAISSEIVDELK